MAKVPVKVWSSVGATLPIPNTYANVKVAFGHERYAKSDREEDLLAVEAEMHEFNKKVLDARLEEHRARLADLEPPPKKKKGKK